MIYGSNQTGQGILTLSPEEHKNFKAGEEIKKHTGSSHGVCTISVRMIYPERLADRYPYSLGYTLDNIRQHDPDSAREWLEKIALGCYESDDDFINETLERRGEPAVTIVRESIAKHAHITDVKERLTAAFLDIANSPKVRTRGS